MTGLSSFLASRKPVSGCITVAKKKTLPNDGQLRSNCCKQASYTNYRVVGVMAMLQQLSEFTADLGKAREPLG